MTLSCWVLCPSPASAEWDASLGYGWVVYGFWYMLFSLLDGLEVSLFCELFVHCRLGDFLMGCTSLEVFG